MNLLDYFNATMPVTSVLIILLSCGGGYLCRRRRTAWPAIFLSLLSCVMIFGLNALVWYLFFRP